MKRAGIVRELKPEISRLISEADRLIAANRDFRSRTRRDTKVESDNELPEIAELFHANIKAFAGLTELLRDIQGVL